jgi:hypothetical protein
MQNQAGVLRGKRNVGARRGEASFGVTASTGSASNYSRVKVLLQSCGGTASKELKYSSR